MPIVDPFLAAAPPVGGEGTQGDGGGIADPMINPRGGGRKIVDPFLTSAETPAPVQSPEQKREQALVDAVPEWGRKYPNLYGMFGATKEVARFAAETAGMVGGGIAGAALTVGNPLGAAAGAGLGYAAVRGIEKSIEGKEPNSAMGTAIDFATGNVGELIPPALTYYAGRVLGPWRTKLTDQVTNALTAETKKYMEAVESARYSPTAAEILGGKSKGMAQLEGILSYLPASSSQIYSARIANLQRLVNLRGNLLEKGANEHTIENVGFRIKDDAKRIIENTIGKRAGIQKEQTQAMLDEFMTEVHAATGKNVRDQALSSALADFYGNTGTATTLHSAGKTVQDMMAQAKDARFKAAGELMEEAKSALRGHEIDPAIARQTADSLIAEELKSSMPDPKVLKVLRPYASPELPPEIQALMRNISGDAAKLKGNQDALKALQEEFGSPTRPWEGLDLDRQKLGQLARNENVLQGTNYSRGSGNTTPAGRIYSILQGAIEDDMAAYAKVNNPDAYAQFIQGRKQWREAKELFDNDALGIMKKNPEDVFRAVINPGEVTNIRKLKEMLGEDDFQPFKEILTRKLIAMDKNGVLDIAKTAKNINSYGNTISEVYSPIEQKQFAELLGKARGIETNFQRSNIMADVIAVDSSGAIRVDATRKNLIKQKEKLGQYFADSELQSFQGVLNGIDGINIHSIARNKSEAMQFLGTVAGSDNAQVVNAIIKPNNTINIRYMKKLLGPERSKEVETKFIENYLLKVNQFGAFSPLKSAAMWKNYDKTMKALFDPATYREISNLMELNRNAATLDRLANNPSQTGQTLIMFQTGKEMLGSVTRSLTAANLTYTMGLATIPWAMAKLYLSPAGRKWLSVGYTIPKDTAAGMELIAKLSEIAGVDLARNMNNEENQKNQDQGK